jgi:hypothetical protein
VIRTVHQQINWNWREWFKLCNVVINKVDKCLVVVWENGEVAIAAGEIDSANFSI